MNYKINLIYILLVFGILGSLLACKGQNITGSKINSNNMLNSDATLGSIVDGIEGGVSTIYQDKNGDYWFGGNENGLYKYDGNKLIVFTVDDGLVSHSILGIQEDKFANIFFETQSGISKFDGQKFTTLVIVEINSSKNEWELNPDDLWFRIGWDNPGPYRFSPSSDQDGNNSLYQLEFPKSDQEDIFYASYPNASYSPYGIYAIYKDAKGAVWFGTSSLGLCKYDGTSIEWLYEKHLTDTPEGGSFGIRSIIEDKDGYFWFCNTQNKFKILPSNLEYNTSIKLEYSMEKGIGYMNDNDELIYPYYMSITQDNEGDLWMATYDDGVWRYDGNKLTHYPVIKGDEEVTIFSIYKDKSGSLWLASLNAGVLKYNGRKFEKFDTF